MPAQSPMPQPETRRTPRTALLALAVVCAAIGAFALAFLVSHHGAPKPAPAKVVDATIKPGPHAATLKRAFVSATIKPLIKPKPKPKPRTTTTATTSTPTPATSEPQEPVAPVQSTPAPTYTPPAPATTTPTKKKPPSGGGIITIG